MSKLLFKLFCRYFVLLSLVLVTIFIFGCKGNVTGYAVESSDKSPEVYFCPREDCGKNMEGIINSASVSVHCAFYDLDLKNIINALSQKSKSIDVRLVMDKDNDEDQVKGDAVRLDNNNQLMHNKFCIIDNNLIITGSFNPTQNDNSKNNNNIVIIHSKFLAENYENEFDELWNGKFGTGQKTENARISLDGIKMENYFCPEDGCASKIISLIDSADTSIYFMAFSFTHEGIADAILRKDSLDIKGIFDSGQASSRYSQFKRLEEFGLDVMKDKSKYKLHHKVFIIDNQTVVTGSFNPTQNGDTGNDENVIIIHDAKIAGFFLEEFQRLLQ